MRTRTAVVVAVMSACLAIPAMPAAATQASAAVTAIATPNASSASVVATTRKPRASVSAILGQSTIGRPKVQVCSNAKQVRWPCT